MAGTPPQAQGRRPFMPQRRAGESFILASSQEWAARPGDCGRNTDSAGKVGADGDSVFSTISSPPYNRCVSCD